jgi:hypothetical protein
MRAGITAIVFILKFILIDVYQTGFVQFDADIQLLDRHQALVLWQ